MSNDDTDALAEAVQQYIDDNDLSIRGCARQADINHETLIRIIEGNAELRRSTLRKLNENLDIDPETLI